MAVGWLRSVGSEVKYMQIDTYPHSFAYFDQKVDYNELGLFPIPINDKDPGWDITFKVYT